MRAIAKKLSITHAYLSMMLNGKRQWTEELYQRYSQLVTTPTPAVTTFGPNLDTKSRDLLLYTQEVTGSSPVLPTTSDTKYLALSFGKPPQLASSLDPDPP